MSNDLNAKEASLSDTPNKETMVSWLGANIAETWNSLPF